MPFAIELGGPSTDGLGVKRWLCGYVAGGSQQVTLFERPRDYCEHPYVLRVENRSGEHIETRIYKTRAGVKERLGKLFGVRAVVFP